MQQKRTTGADLLEEKAKKEEDKSSHQTVLVKSSEVSGRMVSSLGPNIDPACCSLAETGYDHADPSGLLISSDLA